MQSTNINASRQESIIGFIEILGIFDLFFPCFQILAATECDRKITFLTKDNRREESIDDIKRHLELLDDGSLTVDKLYSTLKKYEDIHETVSILHGLLEDEEYAKITSEHGFFRPSIDDFILECCTRNIDINQWYTVYIGSDFKMVYVFNISTFETRQDLPRGVLPRHHSPLWMRRLGT